MTTRWDGARLDEEEVTHIRDNRCPDCWGEGFLKGPEGGGSINFKCKNPDCGSRFNDTPFGITRISDACPESEYDRVIAQAMRVRGVGEGGYIPVPTENVVEPALTYRATTVTPETKPSEGHLDKAVKAADRAVRETSKAERIALFALGVSILNAVIQILLVYLRHRG